MSAAQGQVSSGTILAGRWQIQDFIGSGETGEVYGVRDMHSTGSFALKLFWRSALEQSELWSAVQQTARTASGLGVDGVARTHDFGIDANSSRPFYVAERVAWSSLAERVRQRGPLTAADMASAFSVLARALSAAHGIGLVHRDLKPENVFVAPENANWVRISDFGVSLLRCASPPPPGWGGTLSWVAPDAADPKARSSPAMDVFSLGLVTFFALSGGHLHRAARVNPIDPNALWQELTAPLDSASARARELGAALDPAFDAWFQRAVSADPQARFASVGEMASAFEAIADQLVAPQGPNAVAFTGVAAAIAQPLIFQPESLPSAETRPVEPAASSPIVQSTEPRESLAHSQATRKRNSAPLFIGGALFCFALTALGATALYRHHQNEVAAAESSAPMAAAAPTPTAAAIPTPASAAPAAPEPTAHSATSAALPPAPSAAMASPATSTATAKAPSPPSAQAPTVTPGPIAPKPTATSVPKSAIATTPSPSTAAAKPTTTTATAKAKPAAPAAPKKKCGSVFLPCK